jgi:hypothetical protein
MNLKIKKITRISKNRLSEIKNNKEANNGKKQFKK